MSIVLRGLDLRATYHYRIVASNPDGRSLTIDITLAVPLIGGMVVTPTAIGAGGATITYVDTRRALTTFTVQRRVRGKWVTAGAFSHRDAPGTNRLHWNGRLHRRKLGRGIYRLAVSARAGRSTAATVWARFKIVS